MGLFIIIFLIVVGCFAYRQQKNQKAIEEHRKFERWRNSEEGKKEIAEREIEEEIKWCQNKAYSSERATVTGDYFQPNFYGYATTYYCKFENSSNCMYCCRRREVQRDGKYYYGSSKNCEYYSPYSDD